MPFDSRIMVAALDLHRLEPLDDLRPGSHIDAVFARQRAHEDMWRQIASSLPLAPYERALVVGSGSGGFARLLAEKMEGRGRIDATETDETFVAEARRTADARDAVIKHSWADPTELPFTDDIFELVVVQTDLNLLVDPDAAIPELKRVLRPGGMLAFVSSDLLDHAVVTWPMHIQVALEDALEARLKEGDAHLGLPRQLVNRLRHLGFSDVERRAFPTVRSGPMKGDEATYFDAWLERLWSVSRRYLSAADKVSVGRYVREALERAKDPAFVVTYIDYLTTAIR